MACADSAEATGAFPVANAGWVAVAAISESTATIGLQKEKRRCWRVRAASARGCGETSIKSQAVSHLIHSGRALFSP
jgi:hypothetical protein